MQLDQYIEDDMTRIFTYCWKHQIINCNIQFQNAQGELYMYTYFPYGLGRCDNTWPELINQFQNDKWLRQPYFPSKLDNFYGCPLTGIVRHTPPYALLRSYAADNFQGLEIEMLKEMSRVLNFTLLLKEVEGDDRALSKTEGGFKMVI